MISDPMPPDPQPAPTDDLRAAMARLSAQWGTGRYAEVMCRWYAAARTGEPTAHAELRSKTFGGPDYRGMYHGFADASADPVAAMTKAVNEACDNVEKGDDRG